MNQASKRIIFWWEIALALSSLIPTIYNIFNIPKNFTHSTYVFCMMLLFYNKFRLEGLRSNTIFLIIGIVVASLPYNYCSFIGAIPICICAFFFKSYYLPMDSTTFKIGYQLINFPYKNCKDIISMYYPTTQNTQPTKYLPLSITSYSKKLAYSLIYTGALPNTFFSSIILYLQFHFQKILKLDVQYNAQILSQTDLPFVQKKYQIIIFSHGLGGFQDQLCSFLSNLVGQQGYILVCPMHQDELINPKKFTQQQMTLKTNWELDLEKRYSQISDILDAICDENAKNNFICQTLGLRKSDIDFNKISIAGFSYGSCTAIYSALKEQERIKGVCLALDPWLYPLKEEFYEKELTIPTLILRTSKFPTSTRVFASQKLVDKIIRFFNNQHLLKSKNLIQSCHFKHATHAVFCNEAILSQTDNYIAGQIENQFSVFPLHKQMKLLIEVFLQNMLQNNNIKNFKHANYQFQMQNLHHENWMVIDEFN